MNSLILIVEDDAKIADMLANYLHMHGYTTEILGDGHKALARLRAPASSAPSPAPSPALVLLDLMLPGLDGMAVCRELRTFSALPVIMLTARVDEIDRLLGLETGADDYICKPFSPREVVARIKALLRRANGFFKATAGEVNAGSVGGGDGHPNAETDKKSETGWEIDAAALRVRWQGKALALTPVEFRLLQLLLSRPHQVFGRARLLDAAHLDARDVSDRAIDSHIKNLRKKMETVRPEGAGIVSVYGVGYRYEPE